MGKAQSKRSVDITTEPKKDNVIEEGTGELKKIEEVDFKAQPVNGDTTTHANDTAGEKSTETTTETENEKDSSTEKELQKATESSKESAGGDTVVPVENSVSESKVEEINGDKTPNDKVDETLNESKSLTSGSETPDSTSKKNKKEKVKKKWSFRNISFGKKDKQKPSKKDDGAASANTSGVAINGECEKVLEEGTEEAVPAVENKDDAIAPVEVTVTAAEEIKVIDEVPQPLKEETKTVIETSSPVLNGVAEAKDEISVVENEVEKIVETVPEVKEIITTAKETPIIENKTPEPVTNGNKHHDEITTKMNGSFEATKTEVKNDDNLLIEKELQILTIIKEQSDESIVENANSTNELKNLHGESSLPLPPPLPSTLPPSQVMVFALTETIQEQKNEIDVKDIAIPPPVVEGNLMSNKLDDVINILKNDEISTNLIENEEPTEISLKQNDENSINIMANDKLIDISSNQNDENCNPGEIKLSETIEKINVNKDLVEIEKEILNEKQIESVPEMDQLVDNITENIPENIVVPTDSPVVEAVLNIDPVLKENNQLNDLTVEEVIITGITGNEFIERFDNPKGTDDENSTSMDSPTTQNDNGKITESSLDDELPSPPPTPPTYIENKIFTTDNTNNIINMNLINKNFENMTLQSDENKTELISSDFSSKSNTEGTGTDNPDEDTTNTIKTGGPKNQQNQNNKKENGVAENHQNNDTSATENLNGVDHNKIIEEIKAENQQLDKSAAEITQDTAIIAAE